MFRDGEPIEHVEIYHGIDTGITLSQGMLPGQIPDYEEKAAAIAGHYREDIWKATHWRQKAREVAFYRLNRLILLHTDEARAEAELDHLRNQGR